MIADDDYERLRLARIAEERAHARSVGLVTVAVLVVVFGGIGYVEWVHRKVSHCVSNCVGRDFDQESCEWLCRARK